MDATDKIAWMIERGASEGYWLIGVKDGQITQWDGPHSKPKGVTKALALYKELGFYQTDATYRMVHIGAVQDVAVKINREAIATLRRHTPCP